MSSTFDELDQQIITQLRHDGRQASTEIARQLAVSDTTVRNRIQRLVSEDIIQVVARVNLSRLGYELNVTIGLLCQPGQIASVARELAGAEEVRLVSYVSGRYSLMVAARFRSRGDFVTFLVERLAKIPGIDSMEIFHELQVVKRDYDY